MLISNCQPILRPVLRKNTPFSGIRGSHCTLHPLRHRARDGLRPQPQSILFHFPSLGLVQGTMGPGAQSMITCLVSLLLTIEALSLTNARHHS